MAHGDYGLNFGENADRFHQSSNQRQQTPTHPITLVLHLHTGGLIDLLRFFCVSNKLVQFFLHVSYQRLRTSRNLKTDQSTSFIN